MGAFSVILTGQSLIKHDIRHVRDDGFQTVVDFLGQGDLVFTNFESTILGAHGGWPTKGKYFSYATPDTLDCLKGIGVNALSLANNHAFDLGPGGVLSTLQEVDARGFLYAGIGKSEAAAARPGRCRTRGRDVALVAMDAGPGPSNMYAEDGDAARPARPGVNRLKTTRKLEIPSPPFDAFAGMIGALRSSDLELANYAQPEDPQAVDPANELDAFGTIYRRAGKWGRKVEVDPHSLQQHLGQISHAASAGEFVIAYLHHHHWEPEWREVPHWVQTFARACVDAGADLFVSHGAPVLQALEIYKGSAIFYGLGNFLFHTDPATEPEWSPDEVWESVVAACHYDLRGELYAIELLPIGIDGVAGVDREVPLVRLVPRAAVGRPAGRILKGFADRSAMFGTEIEASEGLGRVRFAARARSLAPQK